MNSWRWLIGGRKSCRSVAVSLIRLDPAQTGRYGMVLPNFVRQALKGNPITVYGNGKQSRCFCYVGDVVAALVGLIQKPEAIGQVFNIGSTEEISIDGLAALVKEKVGSTSPISYVPYDQAYEEGSKTWSGGFLRLKRSPSASGGGR